MTDEHASTQLKHALEQAPQSVARRPSVKIVDLSREL
jgi:hypothetical protein